MLCTLETRKLAGYMIIWQLFQTANILHIPIKSVYPIGCSSNDTRSDMNRVIYCSDAVYNNANSIKIMSTPTQIKKAKAVSLCAFAQSGKKRYM